MSCSQPLTIPVQADCTTRVYNHRRTRPEDSPTLKHGAGIELRAR